MEIEFINHACYLLKASGVQLLHDPWLEGSAFHNGWDLIEKSAWEYSRFDEVSHIWFSHEHPDHFAPANIRKIAPEHRANITVVFQQTRDRKVADFCRNLGFKEVLEINKGWQQLAPGFEVLNRPHTDGDSWLCVRADGKTVLNINDCNLETDVEVQRIKSWIGSGPDVLFTQFSYANSIGNEGDTELRAQFAKAKIHEIQRQIRILKPAHVIPFASFVWFSHEENFFRNDAINTVEKAYREIAQTSSNPVILFPGDSWLVGTLHDPAPALMKWNKSYAENIRAEKVHTATTVSEDVLRQSALEFGKNLMSNNSKILKHYVRPCRVFISDLNIAVEFDLTTFSIVKTDEQSCDVKISSEALHYCFKFLWGGSTTRINGRYTIPPGGNFENFKRYFLISQLNNRGRKFNTNYALGAGLGAFRNKFLKRIANQNN